MKRPMSSEEKQSILDEFGSLSLCQLKDKYKRDFYTVKRLLLSHYTEQDLKDVESRIKSEQKKANNPMSGKCGMLHHRAKERSVTSHGYVEVFAPDWYEGKTDGNKVHEHILEYCRNNWMTNIPKGYVVHHIDLDKTNNAIDNLALMSIGCHVQFHRKLREGVTTIQQWSSFQEEYEAHHNSTLKS